MSDRTDRFEDPISQAIVDGSPYERLRARRHSLFSGSIPTKLRLQGFVLATLTAAVPLLATATATTEGGSVPAALLASPKLTLLGVFAVGVETVAAAGLLGIGAVRLRAEALDERTANRLLNVEDMASMLGLGTGTLAVGLVVLFGVVGLLAPDALSLIQPSRSGGAFSASGTGVPLAVVAVVASALSVVTVVAGHALRRRLP